MKKQKARAGAALVTQDDKKSTKLHHKTDAIDDLDRLGKDIVNQRISSILKFHSQYLEEEWVASQEDMKSEDTTKTIGKGKIKELSHIYEMFPHLPVSRINVIYDEICQRHVDGLIDVLLTIDPSEAQYTTEDTDQEPSTSTSSSSSGSRGKSKTEQFTEKWNLAQYISFDIDPTISELENEYLVALKMKNMAYEEYGFEEEEDTHSSQNVNWDEMNDVEKEFWEDMQLKKERLKKERQFIIQKMKEAKRARNVKIYCRGEEEHLTKNITELKRYQFVPSNELEMEAEYIHFRVVESQFYRLL